MNIAAAVYETTKIEAKLPEVLGLLESQSRLMFPSAGKNKLIQDFIVIFNYDWEYAEFYIESKREYIIDRAIQLLNRAVDMGAVVDADLDYILKKIKYPNSRIKEILLKNKHAVRIVKRKEIIEKRIQEISNQANHGISCYETILRESIYKNDLSNICKYRDQMDKWVTLGGSKTDFRLGHYSEYESRDFVNVLCSENSTRGLIAFFPLPESWLQFTKYTDEHPFIFEMLLEYTRKTDDETLVMYLRQLEVRFKEITPNPDYTHPDQRKIQILLHSLNVPGYKDMRFHFKGPRKYFSNDEMRLFQESCCDAYPQSLANKFDYGIMVFYYRDRQIGLRIMLDVALKADKWKGEEPGVLAMEDMIGRIMGVYRSLGDHEMVNTLDKLRKEKNMTELHNLLKTQPSTQRLRTVQPNQSGKLGSRLSVAD
ncbi:MAG TPA: hypothetical protein PK014_09785 [Thermoanaerobaculia bacterium]|nr:hypothetical protein [Thermoanaerobaculia bacterium]HUM30114.1 hypothetical protein [Thermoanaerobaculia bacterium]HXK68811.1 hypothetical protein [Thermoanaerobaculia bacterium]